MLVPTNTGHDNALARNGRRPLPKRPNGWLSFGSDEIALWVFDVQTDFALAGGTAQSARTRSFFAHNAVQPTLRVMCQSPSQDHHGEIAQFVRRTHKNMSSGYYPKLEIVSRRALHNSEAVNRRHLKGIGSSFSAWGYVSTITREHMKQVYSPETTFGFTIKKWESPSAWGDTVPNIRRLKSWHDIVEGIMVNSRGEAYTQDPEADLPDRPLSKSQQNFLNAHDRP